MKEGVDQPNRLVTLSAAVSTLFHFQFLPMDFWAWALIFLVAAIFFAVLEMFVPSGGILAFLSAMALLGSVALAFQSSPMFGGIYLGGLIVGVPILFWYAVKLWPQTIVGRQILLHPEEDPALQPDTELSALKQLVGKRGTALSKMMMSGLIEVEGKRLNALSESESMEPGDAVIVVKVDGINMIVRKTVIEQPKPEPIIIDPFS